MKNKKYLILLIIWFFVAFCAGYSGTLQNIQPPFPQILIFTIVVLLVLVSFFIKSFRSFLFSISIQSLIAIHITRFVGFYFLVLYSQGKLPYDFAVYGGWGDIAVASGALILIILLRIIKIPNLVINIWNLLGLIDILFVVSTAARLALANPDSMQELLELPLSLLPTFLVPIIIFTHLVIGYRLIYKHYDKDFN